MFKHQDYAIIYKAGLVHADQKKINPYYITNFTGQTTSYSNPHYNQATDEVSETTGEEIPDMDVVPDMLDNHTSVYSIIDEIHLTRFLDNRAQPHITVVFRDGSKIAYYYETPATQIFQINNTDNTPLGTLPNKKLSQWFINLVNHADETYVNHHPEGYVQFWLINMLINYIDSFDFVHDDKLVALFETKPTFNRVQIKSFNSGFKYMKPMHYPRPEIGFLPPTWFPDCSQAPVSGFRLDLFMPNAVQYIHSINQARRTTWALSRGLNKKLRRKSRRKPSRGKSSRGKSRGKPSRRKPSRGKQSRRKSSRRKH